LSKHENNDTTSKSNPALVSAVALMAAASTRITPDEPQDNKSGDGALSTSEENAQPKAKK